ncbi:MAG TPA: helix-turn-helix domain-containing protein [Protaetiibacter sp.]|nr:helix-turn-helix domain-containing protein [Protaetiibacter sp.]
MREFEHPEPSEITLDGVLAALADPLRRSIVRQLADGPAEQRCSRFALPVSPSTRTHHFRVLREAGLISQRYQGTAILSSLRTDDLNARAPGVLDTILAAERRAHPASA